MAINIFKSKNVPSWEGFLYLMRTSKSLHLWKEGMLPVERVLDIVSQTLGDMNIVLCSVFIMLLFFLKISSL